MAFINEYQRFLSSDKVDDTTKNELYAIRNQEDEIKERFSAPLSFGTAGLRGILRAGLNGMNIYTVRHATQALCEVISDAGSDAMARGVVIAYDSRIMSSEFAKEAAGVIAANKIKVYLFDELRPTPELSFAIRQLHAIAGINVTASHNPKEYNGYKVYWEDGGQLPPEHAQMVSDRMNSIDIFDGIKHVSFETGIKAGFISIIGREIDEEYIKNVLAQAVNPEAVKKAADSFKVVYTPFHGSGYKIVPEVLRRAGMKHILMVKEQEKPDGNFPTVKSPNPEDKEGFSFAVALAKQNDIDLLIGTDPDADRVGILVRDKENGYIPLTGNQVGCILIDYILNALEKENRIPENAAIIKSIVTTNMAKKIAESYHVEMIEVLTGFKFIGEKIKLFEEDHSKTFLFGFEESYGYLKGTYARDKDAVVASMLIAEAASSYYLKGMSLYDAMEALYQKYGYYEETVVSVSMKGLDGHSKMSAMMADLRLSPPKEIAGIKVLALRDYKSGKRTDFSSSEITDIDLPSSDVLYFDLCDGSSFIVRPSGTEPKVKIYIMTSAKDKETALESKQALVREAKNLEQKYS